MNSSLSQRCISLLQSWAQAAEKWWVDVPVRDGQPVGFYGTGYNQWGVQTNQKYLAAMGALGVITGDEHATQRAVAALRYSLRTHRAAEHDPDGLPLMDTTRWGHTWISPLGVERMMFAVRLLKPHLTQDDHAALKRMLVSEAAHQCDHHTRGRFTGIHCDKWNSSGKNNPESNLWTGCLLWRAAVMHPDHPAADAWRDKAEAYLFNGVSIDADAGHERFVGANMFPHYALDHHGYFNVGYMVICASNAALLHFDLKAAGLPRPDHLDHHQGDLWQAIRPMIFADGRLARLGGDSRLRYTYCQEYLLPALLYAADHLGDAQAMELAGRQLSLIETEHQHAGDGSFYGKRLREMADRAPYYYTRLESDRACVLGHLLACEPLVGQAAGQTPPTPAITIWHEPEYGAVMHRSGHRLASFAWRAHGYAQGLCLPPGRSDLADWTYNLAGRVRFVGDPGAFAGGQSPHRRLESHHTRLFDGGFATIGRLTEGMNLSIPEGLSLQELATHDLCFVALPDGRSVVGMQRVVMREKRAHVHEIKGMHLNIPNDLYNAGRRTLATARGTVELTSPPSRDELVALDSRWACVDQVLGVIGLYGSDTLTVDRSRLRRGGYHHSLHVEELCWPARIDTHACEPGQVILDAGWRVVSDIDAAVTQSLASQDAQLNAALPKEMTQEAARSVTVMGVDGRRYRVSADFTTGQVEVDVVG